MTKYRRPKKHVFAFIGLSLFASAAIAQIPVRALADLPTALCTSGELENRLFVVSDGLNASDAVTGGGSAGSVVICDGGAWRSLAGIGLVIERKVTNVTVADDGAGTKPAGAIPITTDYATCTCNDATGCAMTIAEPTPTTGYGRSLTVFSIGTGNCEFADSAGVLEIGAALVLEPTSTALFGYANSSWYRISSTDNVP